MCGLKDYRVCAKTYFIIFNIETSILKFQAGLWGIPVWTDMDDPIRPDKYIPWQAQILYLALA